jgi:transcriptional regulator with XRE-family HTH domain
MTLVVVEEKQKILLQFGQRVRELRSTKGLSQEAFAALCGLDRTYISGIERGVRNLSLINIHALADALEISISELMQEL